VNPYAIIVAAIVGFSSAWAVQGWRYGEQIATMQKEAAQATTKAVQKAMEKTQADQKRKDDALQEANLRAQKNAALARDLDGDVDRMRKQLAANTTSLPGATCEASRNYATTISGLLEACTTRYSDVARAATGHASDVKTLESAWPE